MVINARFPVIIARDYPVSGEFFFAKYLILRIVIPLVPDQLDLLMVLTYSRAETQK